MQKIGNFDIVINKSLWDINQGLSMPNLSKNDFILSVINGFEDGKWREKEFHRFIFNNIAQTGLSAEDRDNLYSESPYTTLTESIKNLRLVDKDNGKGSEIAEIVLYGIMRYHYHALPVVPKIFYKQNPKDNAKGADSVHIVLDDKGDFSLWLGEAKFYNDIADERMYEPINSVFDTISTDKIKKENSIITIKDFHLNRAQKYFVSQNNKQEKENIYGYENIQFHLILFPVPQKEDIVNCFIERAKQIKEDA